MSQRSSFEYITVKPRPSLQTRNSSLPGRIKATTKSPSTDIEKLTQRFDEFFRAYIHNLRWIHKRTTVTHRSIYALKEEFSNIKARTNVDEGVKSLEEDVDILTKFFEALVDEDGPRDVAVWFKEKFPEFDGSEGESGEDESGEDDEDRGEAGENSSFRS
jgi:hypothetical protein